MLPPIEERHCLLCAGLSADRGLFHLTLDDPFAGHDGTKAGRHQQFGPDRRDLPGCPRPARLPLQRRHLHHFRRSLGQRPNLRLRHQRRGPDRRVLRRQHRHIHGFLLTITPNPPPPGGTTADMILRHTVADGQYEIYDIGNNALLAALPVGPGRDRLEVRRPRRFLRQRHHRHAVAQRAAPAASRSTTSATTSSPTPPSSARSAWIGRSWVSAISRSLGETDMMLRNVNTGGVEVYDISNNQITSAAFMGTVGLNWQFSGVGNFIEPRRKRHAAAQLQYRRIGGL